MHARHDGMVFWRLLRPYALIFRGLLWFRFRGFRGLPHFRASALRHCCGEGFGEGGDGGCVGAALVAQGRGGFAQAAHGPFTVVAL
jgi:hypothetical protein